MKPVTDSTTRSFMANLELSFWKQWQIQRLHLNVKVLLDTNVWICKQELSCPLTIQVMWKHTNNHMPLHRRRGSLLQLTLPCCWSDTKNVFSQTKTEASAHRSSNWLANHTFTPEEDVCVSTGASVNTVCVWGGRGESLATLTAAGSCHVGV